MSRNRCIISILCLMILSGFSLYVQPVKAKSTQLTNKDGLGSSSVTELYQDSKGYLWIGTWDGLYCYDGNKVKPFKRSLNGAYNLSHPVVRRIFEDKTRCLWVVTDYGVNRISLLSGNYDNYYLSYESKSVTKEHAFDACGNSKGDILATSFNTGLYYFDRTENRFTHLESNKNIPSAGIAGIFFDSKDNFFILYSTFMLQCEFINSDGKPSVKRLKVIPFPKHTQHVIYDHADRVWLQDSSMQLHYIHTSTADLHQVTLDIDSPINDVVQTSDGYLFATASGVAEVKGFTSSSWIYNGISLSVLKGSQNITWIGTDAQGLHGILPSAKFFSSYTRDELPWIGSYAVRAMTKDKLGRLWIGTKGGGMMSVSHLGSNLMSAIHFDTSNGLADNSVYSLLATRTGDIWIGGDGNGIQYYSQRHNKILPLGYIGKGRQPSIQSVYDILQQNDSTLWVATSGHGLFRLRLVYKNGIYHISSFRQFNSSQHLNALKSNIIYSLAMQGSNRLWIATRGGGLSCMNLSNFHIDTYRKNVSVGHSISSNDVISVFVDANNQVWAGTSSGLNRLTVHEGKVTFSLFSLGNEAYNGTVHAMAQDSEGQLWASTNNGIYRINTNTDATVYYNIEDGLQSNEYADGSAYASKGGTEIYFGGPEGFSIFHPEQISSTEHKPSLCLSSLQINSNYRPLPENFDSPLKLSYKDNTIIMSFSIIEFIANRKCQMTYRLLRNGQKDADWIHLSDSRQIILPNLTPGDYVLQVSYSNPDNIWYDSDISIPFVISPPWWQSWWAILTYILLFAVAALWMFFSYRHRMFLRHSYEISALERAKEEEIHQAKLRFFTNIAHEFSNSIALIYGPCERIISECKVDETAEHHLKTIRRNAERMQRLIQQLMDFRRAETGHLTMKFENVDVCEIVKYTIDYFADISEKKLIRVNADFASQQIPWVIDRDAMEKIVFNLLSNAFKYSPYDSEINLRLFVADNSLYFSCANQGQTINPEDQVNIFNRFKVLDNFEAKLSQGVFTRNGIGLAMCKDLAGLMNGGISVESSEDGVNEFTVVIGKNEVTRGNASIDSSEVTTTISAADSSMTVLVVDDQEEMRTFISEILSPKYSVKEAEDGQQALDIMSSTMTNIVVCDVVMPGMDGIEFLRRVKSNEKMKHIPVILLSSKASIESQIAGLEKGAEMYIGKPFHPSFLLAAVDRILSNKDIMKEYVQSAQAYTEKYKDRVLNRNDKEFLDKTLEILKANIANEEFSLESLASILAVSRVQLYRKIKQITGQTPSELVRNYRMEKAKHLVSTSQLTIQEIMADCGFQNKSYFYREFSKDYGMTPREYRRLHQGDAK